MRAAVFHRVGSPLTIEEAAVDEPKGREVLIRTVACGVCHSDLHIAEGRWSSPTPVILGHEAAGIVEAVGKDVTHVNVGDHVIVCLSVFCGQCEGCLTGHPYRCTDRGQLQREPAADPRTTLNGRSLNQMSQIGGFAEQMLVHENATVKVPLEVPLDRAALFGCSVTVGLGAVIHSAKVEAGSVVAVFGVGAVGLNVIQGSSLVGAREIIAVDISESKAAWAKQFGATHTIDAASDDPAEVILGITGQGVDYSFEAVGSKQVFQQAFRCLRPGGTATVIGMMPMGEKVEIDAGSLLWDRKVQGSAMGSNRFRVDVPRYLDLYRQGRIKVDQMVTRRAPLDDVNGALAAIKSGEVIRSVLTFD